MIRNHIKIGFRKLMRNKAFTIINTAGLALGIAVFLLIMEYVAFEWSANRFHKNFDQLYRISVFHDKSDKGDYYLAPGLSPLIKNNFPAVKASVRIAESLGSGVISLPANKVKADGVKSFRENNVSFADDNFFKVFSFPLIAGSTLFNQPQTIAISQSKAKKYFGGNNAIGKLLTVSNQFGTTTYTVTAVFKDIPEQSDIQGDLFLSFKTLENPALRGQNDWADPNGTGSGFSNIYLLLNKEVNTRLLSQNMTAYFHKILPDSKYDKVGLQPMRDLHLAPGFNYGYQTFGSIILVISFLSIAILILIIAWVNYVNLSTAQALYRAKEVGVRKILGAGKSQVIGQQLIETGILMIMSIAAALFIVQVFQPAYNNFTVHTLSLGVLNNGLFWLVCIFLILMGTFMAGGYISLVLSSFNPLKTIRGKAAIAVGGISLRKILVVFQFTVSIVFITGTIILYRQLHFMQSQDLGFNPGQLLVITGPTQEKPSGAASQAFENQVSALPFIKKYAASNNVPGQGYNFSTQGITRTSPKPGDEKNSYNMLIVDDKYFDTYGMKIKEGLTFSPLMVTQGWRKIKKVMLNEAAAAQLGFKTGEPVAEQKIKWGDDYEVVGVIKNYHHLSLHTLIEPMIFLPAKANGYYTVKIDAGNTSQQINQLRNIYHSSFPEEPFNYSFVDEAFNLQYKDEQKMGLLFISATVIAIFIACLGLFGLAAFAAKQRTKEIGIRKVLGAGMANIITMLAGDFIKLIIVASLIASPVAWYIMQKWLQGFAYRIDIQWWMFLLAGTATAFIAFVIISFQSVKTALTNPVDSLRSE